MLEDKVAPEPPRSLAAIPDESEPRVTLVWTPPVRDAVGGELSGLAGYAILRRESGSGGTVPVDTVAAETRQYVDEGLKALTSYSYSIVAFDEAGNISSLSQVVQVTTPGMPVPANLAAESRAGHIEVSWAAVSDEELLGYDVYRSERPDESFERLPGTEGTPFTTGRTSYVDNERGGGPSVLLQGAVGGPYAPFGAVLPGGCGGFGRRGVSGSSSERVGSIGGGFHGSDHGALERTDDGRGRG